MAPRRPTRLLPFRIPFFRIFYSTTYTILYAITIALLAITPTSMMWAAVEQRVYQYPFMIGATYMVVALIAIFIYSSRLYTNQTVLAGVGKAYIPVEDGEVGQSVRKMIVKQLERSAVIAWESRPRDLLREVLRAEELGLLPAETASVGRNDYTVGREIPLDPARPPWGTVQHEGWSSPAENDDAAMPDLQFDTVVAELPNLVEAKAVSLAPADPTISQTAGAPIADLTVVEILRRPATMGLRNYLMHLSQLGIIHPPELAADFSHEYEAARFSGRPIKEEAFNLLMDLFSRLLSGMTELDEADTDRIRAQFADDISIANSEDFLITPAIHLQPTWPEIRSSSSSTSTRSPVTARTRPSRNTTPYLQQDRGSTGSVVHYTPEEASRDSTRRPGASSSRDSASLRSFPSDVGSVLRHPSESPDHG